MAVVTKGFIGVDESLQSETEMLLVQARQADSTAIAALLNRFRGRLARMIRCRMAPQLQRRFDPSDVVQETLVTAAAKLPGYLREQPVSFYPWLRRLAWERLVDLQREHLSAQRRSVLREESGASLWSDDSLHALAQSLASPDRGPLTTLLHQEHMAKLYEALAQLDETNREVIVLRYQEGLSLAEVAEVMSTTVAAVKMRHLRAVRQLRELFSL